MMMDRIPCTQVEVSLADAPIARSGEARTAGGWDEAGQALARWAAEMPGERLSCDFLATFEDGFRYSGSMEFGKGRSTDLRSHVDGFVAAVLSDDPAMDSWRKFADPDGARRAALAEARERYDLGEAPEAAAAFAPSK